MHSAVQVRSERRRGCGWRKVGGLYLVCDTLSIGCGRLPLEMKVCPCCGRGVKPARGWTWVDGMELFRQADKDCKDKGSATCEGVCPLSDELMIHLEPCGLIWVGESYYPTVSEFEREVSDMGLSRRINAVPRGFKLGETWVFLAHRNAVLLNRPEFGDEPDWAPGIFRMFRPEAVEVIVDESTSDETIEGYLERGLTPVLVQRLEDTQAEMSL